MFLINTIWINLPEASQERLQPSYMYEVSILSLPLWEVSFYTCPLINVHLRDTPSDPMLKWSLVTSVVFPNSQVMPLPAISITPLQSWRCFVTVVCDCSCCLLIPFRDRIRLAHLPESLWDRIRLAHVL